MPVFVVLLGPPGSGKGTQAKRLSKLLGIPHISSGDLFRAMRDADTPLARQVQQIMAEGGLVPDDVTIRMVGDRLAAPDARSAGALLDGFPRTTAQAAAFDALLAEIGVGVSTVLLMNISEDEAVRRISGRRVCPVCERVYHVEFNPPAKEGVCDVDGAALIQREDDQPDVVRDRYRVYLEKTAPLVDYYREQGLLTEIDANRPIDEITPDMVSAIREASAMDQA